MSFPSDEELLGSQPLPGEAAVSDGADLLALADELARARQKIVDLEVVNERLRHRLAEIHNNDVHEITADIETIFIEWKSKMRKANRAALSEAAANLSSPRVKVDNPNLSE